MTTNRNRCENRWKTPVLQAFRHLLLPFLSSKRLLNVSKAYRLSSLFKPYCVSGPSEFAAHRFLVLLRIIMEPRVPKFA